MAASGRILAIDYGKRKVGLAISDPDRIIASPKGFLPRRLAKDPEAVELISDLLKICEAEEVTLIVLGEPLRTDGRPHEWLDEVHRFGAALAAATKLPLEYFDERYTTTLALKTFEKGVNIQKRKNEVDGRAAAILLTDYLRRCAIIADRVDH
ncbi:MAG: Holliday junction resolvase RuvX [Eubacteriales bacterium]|nr:Holliday junction resolvase RuvX [Eubacteriales bacterium]